MDSASKHIADVFTDLHKIGEGTYGTVYKVRTKQDGELKALKQIRLNQGCEGVPSTCIREVCLLKELTHPNIVHLEDVMIHKGRKLYLIFEFIDQDLKMLLERLSPRPLPVPNVKSFIWQMLQALAYCHTHRVVHRDLKPQNLLVKNDGTIKLADFGLARSGLISWEFHFLPTWAGVERFPDYKNNFPKWKRRDMRELITILDEDGIELLKQMLVYPPMDRITAKLALSHRFLRDMTLKLHDITLLYEK
uniref:cyclin-dependent kinase n=1 Tax=Meloidogyne floridensis TaxID=298350 RepID=A0A915PC36_9BILA